MEFRTLGKSEVVFWEISTENAGLEVRAGIGITIPQPDTCIKSLGDGLSMDCIL